MWEETIQSAYTAVDKLETSYKGIIVIVKAHLPLEQGFSNCGARPPGEHEAP